MVAEQAPGRTGGNRFPRLLRLCRRAEFRAVFDRGRSRSDGRLIVYALCRDDGGPTRLGMAVARRYGNAPERNLLKRRLREAFRTNAVRLPPSTDLVVLPSAAADGSGFPALESSLIRTAGAAAALYRKKGPRPARPR